MKNKTKIIKTAVILAMLSTGVDAAASAHPNENRLILKNALLMTMAEGQKTPFTGYLVVNDKGQIADIGAGAPPAALRAQETFDAHGQWVLPGFISAHSQMGASWIYFRA